MTDFEALYGKYSRDVYRFALYLCGDHAEAEDIAAETFARAWNANGAIRAATAKAYLLTIARNCYLEGLRRGKPQTQLDDAMADPAASPSRDAESRIELRRVLEELQRMPEVDRTVLLLHVQEGMPYQAIAGAVGLSLPAVKVKIHRARLKLALWRAAQETKR
jgi:RNA polymerase sigma-70 factor (ECF subfamily)